MRSPLIVRLTHSSGKSTWRRQCICLFIVRAFGSVLNLTCSTFCVLQCTVSCVPKEPINSVLMQSVQLCYGYSSGNSISNKG